MAHRVVTSILFIVLLLTLSGDRMAAQKSLRVNILPPSLSDQSTPDEPFLCGKENFKIATTQEAESGPAAHSVSLSWNASTSLSSPPLTGYEGYNVYRENSDGSCVKLNGAQLLEKTSYVDLSVTNGETYRYAITAVKKKGTAPPSKGEESDVSNVAKVRIPPA